MQTTPKSPKPPKGRASFNGGPLSSKNGSVAAAGVAAAVAGLLIVLFLQQYRDKVDESGIQTPVLVASQLIERGASGDSIGAEGLFKSVDVPRDQLKDGAVTDAATLRGKLAGEDILPGQQLTAGDFKKAGKGLLTKLAADERAMTVSLDSAHGLVGQISTGDHVDVLSGFMVDTGTGRERPVLRMLMQDVLVLDVPKKASGSAVGGGANKTSDITLRVATAAAPKIAFAADNGKLWLVLRPGNGAKLKRGTLVTLGSLLAEERAVRVPRSR